MFKLKKVFLAFSIVFLMMVTSGCTPIESGKLFYDIKVMYVMLSGDPTLDISGDSMSDVEAAYFVGERDIRYHLIVGNSYSATANLGYNISYLLNIPAKLIHNIKYDYKMTQEDFKPDEELEQSLEDKIGYAMLDVGLVFLIIMDIIYSIIGLICSYIMIPVGTVIGLLLHPIDSILNIPDFIWGLIKTIFAAVSNIFVWEG